MSAWMTGGILTDRSVRGSMWPFVGCFSSTSWGNNIPTFGEAEHLPDFACSLYYAAQWLERSEGAEKTWRIGSIDEANAVLQNPRLDLDSGNFASSSSNNFNQSLLFLFESSRYLTHIVRRSLLKSFMRAPQLIWMTLMRASMGWSGLCCICRSCGYLLVFVGCFGSSIGLG